MWLLDHPRTQESLLYIWLLNTVSESLVEYLSCSNITSSVASLVSFLRGILRYIRRCILRCIPLGSDSNLYQRISLLDTY